MLHPASKTIDLYQQQQQHEKPVNIAMNFKQTQGKDALYYLITQKHELMAKATFDHDYLALDFDPSSWYKNCICIKQVLHSPCCTKPNEQAAWKPCIFSSHKTNVNRTNNH